MGQTLTHGVYLPDEGERNCYSGLAANWQILDTSVGTIAAHTAALAGKAPLVHTHTVSQITDFPAYGNAAGTICEGNDSRLSDARTPVAHTHTKSDVTDLLNSNFVPSANNSYNLGTSSYQWNNLYAKNYYYNGVAWGLDKANVWTGNNQFNASVRFNGHTGINWARGGTTGTLPSSVLYYGFQNALDSNDNIFDRIRSYVDTAGTNFQEHVKYAWNDLTKYVIINYWINADGSDSEYKLSVKRIIPASSNATDLGTSTNKWKSFNGINPGALSLPDYNDTTYIDISGSIVPPSGQTTINYSGGENQYTPPVDGWLSIRCDGATFLQIYRNAYNCPGTTASRQDTGGKLVVTLPVLKNTTYTIRINTSGTTNIFQLYPCLGNV